MDLYKHWRPYEQDNKKNSNKIDLDDTPSIYLRELWKIEGYKPLVKERSKWSEMRGKNNQATILVESDDENNQEKKEVKIISKGEDQGKKI